MHTTPTKIHYILSVLVAAFIFASCQESMQDKAERDAKEYTRKYCPTPVINYMRTDSVVFDKNTDTYTYFCTFCQNLDNKEIIKDNESKIKDILKASILESTSMKQYIEAGFRFRYVCRSEKAPKTILLQVKF